MKLLELARPALERGEHVEIELPIKNTNRTVGTILGSEISRRYGLAGLPDGTIKIEFKGSAGQSLGAWLPKGIQIRVEGDANDYVGKGLSGGRVIVRTPATATYEPTENIVAGNVLLYGATGGEAFFHGLVGERFCVRNSGAEAVVEGVGDHGCEYMTGGRAIILGPTGRNFAAGMSGGIAYVLDENGEFPGQLNPLTLVDLDPVVGDDVEYVRNMLRKHFDYTRSRRAEEILRKWDTYAPMFVKVYPQGVSRGSRGARPPRGVITHPPAVGGGFDEDPRRSTTRSVEADEPWRSRQDSSRRSERARATAPSASASRTSSRSCSRSPTRPCRPRHRAVWTVACRSAAIRTTVAAAAPSET